MDEIYRRIQEIKSNLEEIVFHGGDPEESIEELEQLLVELRSGYF